MKPRRYFLLAIILLLILGIFLTLGIMNSRKVMMDLIKDEARSFLTIVASTQENSIFAEGKFEDAVIEKLINISNYLESVKISSDVVEKVRTHFNFNSITIFSTGTKKKIISVGTPGPAFDDVFSRGEPIFFEYFIVAHKKYLRFIYRTEKSIFAIIVSAAEIDAFRQEFGIDGIINQLALNPMIRYLVLQDRKGIIFATPNIKTISKIDDDLTLLTALDKNREASRISEFEKGHILELVRPFVVEGRSLGLFRIGISLEDYYRHVRLTERQLIILFVILFGLGFGLFFLFIKYQSYVDLKDLFDKTLGAIEDAVLVVNKHGTITGINKTLALMTSYDEDILTNKNYSAVFEQDYFDIARVLKEGTKIVNEKPVLGKQIQYATYPLLDEKKRISGAIAVLRDVTKLREFEKEREEAEQIKILGNLVANFAHEIKNPLNGLAIAAQRLVKEFPSQDDEYQHLTTTLKKEIESLNKILNDFLSLVRPRIKEQKEFDLSDLVDQTLNLVREQVKTSGITLRENINKNIKYVGNHDDLKRAFLNILLNAVDAVSAIADRKKEIAIELSSEQGRISLLISDNGVGMDEEERARIFTPYFTTKKGGTGLGLYIAQRIIKENRGEVRIETAKNRGTKFEIGFP